MKIVHSFYEPEIISGPCVIALGTFDGLHLGHRDVLSEARNYAEKNNLQLLAFTFSNHPLTEISPESVPPKLIASNDKELLLDDLGIDILVSIPFTHEFAHLLPEEFIEKLKVFPFKCLIVGENYSYGYRGCGNTESLKEEGRKQGFEVKVRKLVELRGTVVSSSKIRELLLNGNVELANEMLGREYAITGKVVGGDKRGNGLGFPTANLQFNGEGMLVPARGVYAVKVALEGREYSGMANFGYNPTFGDIAVKRMEVNIFDFFGDIYGRHLTIKLLHFVRHEMKFASPEELVRQLCRDREIVKVLLADV
ncbi:MAG: bifunctional riboflavin kinase/FAD synthetase [Acidaminococcaceae bacterium]|nr:bifunctional riboflavin kinase/FAD synthetase [Acidaminococcaceae bacterium]